MKPLLFLTLVLLTLPTLNAQAEVKLDVRIGVLELGTVNWELAVLNKLKLLETRTLQLKPRSIANSQAGKVALLSGTVDMIVADWIWVSNQRAAGRDLTFVPYSNAAGALIIPNNSTIRSIKDLAGKRLGIAGGGLDKNWLLLQGLAKQTYKIDLDKTTEKVFAAPPLLNQQLLQGRLEALINYWHYAARLEAQGYKRLLDGQTILKQLGVQRPIPTLGYVFSESWAADKTHLLTRLFNATRQAKQAICQSESSWQTVIPLTRSNQPAVLKKLREYYCQGVVTSWGKAEKQAVEQTYQLLHKLGNSLLTQSSEHLQAGTFWPYEIQP